MTIKSTIKEYIGCYANDPSLLDFLTIAAHVFEPNLNPVMCARACDGMGYPVSTIQFRQYCFCKKTSAIVSPVVNDSFCMTSDSMCAYDSNNYCGTNNYNLVYGAITNVS